MKYYNSCRSATGCVDNPVFFMVLLDGNFSDYERRQLAGKQLQHAEITANYPASVIPRSPTTQFKGKLRNFGLLCKVL